MQCQRTESSARHLSIWMGGIFFVLFIIGIILIAFTTYDQTSEPVPVHILAINDFHGQICQGQKMNSSPVGGAPVLGGYLRDAINRYGKNNTIIALPGDMTGHPRRSPTCFLMNLQYSSLTVLLPVTGKRLTQKLVKE